MPGGNQAPYREPCAGRPPANKVADDCGRGSNPAHKEIPRQLNVTLVPSTCVKCDNCSEGDPVSVPPFPKTYCTSYDPPLEDCNDVDCGPWVNPGNVYATPPEDQPQTVDLSVPCGIKKGFKAIYGKKHHHGRMGNYASRFPVAVNADGSCHGHGGPWNDPQDTRYLKLNVSALIHDRLFHYGPGTSGAEGLYQEHNSDFDSDCTVNRFSGRQTGARTETFYNYVFNLGTDPDITHVASPEQRDQLDDLLEDWVSFSAGDLEAFFRSLIVGIDGTLTSTGGGLAFEYYFDAGGGGFQRITATCDLAGGTVAFSDESQSVMDGEVIGKTLTLLEASVSNTAVAFKRTVLGEGWNSGGYARQEVEVEFNSLLALPYTTSQVRDDVVSALAHWNLADDAQIPWRTDGNMSRGPLVTFNERGATGPVVWPADVEDPENPGDFIPWADAEVITNRTGIIWGAEEYNEGEIIGKPLPTGYAAFFDFHAVVWRFVMTGTGLAALGAHYGESSPFPHATLWVENDFGMDQDDHLRYLPPGPFVSLASLVNPEKYTTDGGPVGLNPDTLWMCKWAEVIQRSPSHDFFRPCGADRDAMQWFEPETPRWPAAWPICGRIRIESASVDSGTVTVTLETAAHLITGDTVDILNYGGDFSESITDAGKTVTVLNETQFTYPGGSVPTGEYVKTSGSPHYQWHDTRSKGQFLYKEWSMNFRDFWESYLARRRHQAQGACSFEPNADPVRYTPIPADEEVGSPELIGAGAWWYDGFTQTEGCVQHQHCAPSVVMVTPNAEERPGAVVYAMPDDGKVLDTVYGSFYLGRVDQITYDPLYNAEDPPLYVEAIATHPTDAPALPVDAVPLGCADFMANLAAGAAIWAGCQPQYQFWLELNEEEWTYRQFAAPSPQYQLGRWALEL